MTDAAALWTRWLDGEQAMGADAAAFAPRPRQNLRIAPNAA